MKRNPTDVNIVEKPFSDQSYLSDHMGMQIMQRDSNLAKYRLYTEDSAFARHYEIDTDKNTCQCKYCDKTFSSDSDLCVYMGIHTGEKQYQCINCENK